MSAIEDRLNNLLSDPKEMEKLMGFVKGLAFSGENNGSPAEEDGPDMASFIRMFSQVLREQGDGGKAEILNAMKPYLCRDRRELMDRAARIARIAGIARICMSGLSGGNGLV